MSFNHNPDSYNTKSAIEVVPLILDFVVPESILDVGCGIGTWLSIFKKHGINNLLGIDGDYINKEKLFSNINNHEFMPHDLTKPLKLEKKFDLVLSLEVAEHLPEDRSDIFIESLTQLGSYILFSAAIPGQGGDGHLNEQWPTYWEKKFNFFNFIVYDCIRPKIWTNKNIEWWYRQNIFLAVNKNIKFLERDRFKIQDIVHPELYLIKSDYINLMENHIKNNSKNKINSLLNLFKGLKVTLKAANKNKLKPF